MRFSSVISCSVAFCAILAGCSGGKDSGQAGEPVPVKVMTIQEQSELSGRNYVGTVEASKTTVLSCPYPGTLTRLAADVGDIVRKGDTIAVIVSQNVLSTKEMAEATLAQAEDGYKRLSQVYGSGSVAEVKMVEIQTQLSKARASAEAARKAVDDCTVTAPFDGVIGEVFTEEGVETNAMAPLARLLDISCVEIEFSVPEKEIGSVDKGDIYTVEVPALDGAVFQARVKSKGITASALSHSYSCTLTPTGNTAGLMPGMVCRVYGSGSRTDGLVIPASVVKTDGNGRYVWTVREGKVEKRYITTGGFAGKGVSVESGLQAGDQVIVEGSQKVSSGMKVSATEKSTGMI